MSNFAQYVSFDCVIVKCKLYFRSTCILRKALSSMVALSIYCTIKGNCDIVKALKGASDRNAKSFVCDFECHSHCHLR